MKIYLLSNGIDKTIFYQKWYDPNKDYGGKVIEIPDGYEDCIFEDFTNGAFDLSKYNERHTLELNEQRKFEIRERLNQLSQDFVQVWCGAEFEDLNSRIVEFQLLHNELRILDGKEPRAYLHENPENTENTVDENV